MRILLAQLAPRTGDVRANLERVRVVAGLEPADLAVFPELFLSGYRVGDRIHRLALREGDAETAALRAIARESRATIVVGTALASAERHGEIQNAVIAVRPDGEIHTQVKRYLPNFGPFEEGAHFTPADESQPVDVAARRVGLQVCYDTFFPEVSRALALGGAEILVVVSASPVTSAAMFAKLLPARAIENSLPVVFVNRVGVEDGVIFAGGSGAWDARGEPLPLARVPLPGATAEEALFRVDIDPVESARWRPFRPVLRDVATRPGIPAAGAP
ncbi:MAG TPA: carbon-nitrogen hydrolase family protein [Thermoplasmata archaeon]|nr:carbon-nitrogen hydrolase family protein [Thermoplasmata archaeon]